MTGVSGSDNLGNHTATQSLDLNNFNLVNVSSLTARGAITSYSSATVAGELGVGAAVRFDNNVEISSAAAAFNGGIYISTNVYIVGIASAAKYYGDGSGLYGVVGGNVIDTLSATLGAGTDAGGLDITNAGNIAASGLGVGITPAAGTLEVNDADANTLTSGLKFTNFSCSGTDKLTVGVDGKVVCQPDAVGGGTGNLVDNLFDTLGMGDDAGGRAIQNAGSITASSLTATGAPGLLSARVRFNSEVEISSDTSGAFAGVRISSNVYVVGFSSAAKYYGDGSALTGITVPDTLGDHTATQDLDLNTFNLVNVASLTARGAITAYSSVTIAADLGIGAAVRFDNNVEISSAADFNGGIYVSTNIYIVGIASAAKYYGDGSALTGTGSDDLGSHIATTDLDLNNFNLLNVGAIAANPASSVTVVGVLQSFGSGYTQVWRNSIGVEVASMTDVGVLYADGSQLRNLAGGGGGTLSDMLTASGNAGNGYIVNLSSLAIGRATADVPLDVQQEAGGNIRIQKWRDNLGIEVASMRSDGGLYSNSVEISSRLAVGNQAATEPSVISIVAGVFDDADISYINIGVGAVSYVFPTSNKVDGQLVIGGSFYGGIPVGAGVTADFPTLVGVRGATMANTAGQVTNAYGLYTQNEQTAGVVVNNYGVYVATPVLSGGAITNNYGIYISTQSGLGTTTDYNIYSAGAASKNVFEGTVQMHLPSRTKAQLQTGVPANPTAVGEMYYCSDCTVSRIVVSTGTATGAFSDAMGAAIN